MKMFADKRKNQGNEEKERKKETKQDREREKERKTEKERKKEYLKSSKIIKRKQSSQRNITESKLKTKSDLHKHFNANQTQRKEKRNNKELEEWNNLAKIEIARAVDMEDDCLSLQFDL